MDSINSWINEDEVRKLAEDLSSSPEAAREWKKNDYDGFAIPEKQGEPVTAKKVGSETVEEVATDIAQEVKDSKASSLAGASAMAASAGMLGGRKKTEPNSDPEIKEVAKKIIPETVTKPVVASAEAQVAALPPLCDHCLNEVPVNVDENKKAALPSVHAEKGLGTFEQIDNQLSKTVKANGICVIDRDGDVLYSSMKNPSLVAFTIDSMMGTKLMRTQEGEFGNIRVKISAQDYLEFVSVKTTRGVLVLAASMDHVLGNTNAQYVAGDVLKIANLV